MAKVKAPKVLYFIDGAVPNVKNEKLAHNYRSKGLQIAFRNARYANVEDNPEPEVSGVMGDESVIPAAYKKYPRVESVAATFADDFEEKHHSGHWGKNEAGELDNNGAGAKFGVVAASVAPPAPPTAEEIAALAAKAAAEQAALAAGGKANPFAK